jgi:hypothetical protein
MSKYTRYEYVGSLCVNKYEMAFWMSENCPICSVKDCSGRHCNNCDKLVCLDCYPELKDCLNCHINRGLPLNPEWQERAAKLYEPGERRYQQAEKIVANLK